MKTSFILLVAALLWNAALQYVPDAYPKAENIIAAVYVSNEIPPGEKEAPQTSSAETKEPAANAEKSPLAQSFALDFKCVLQNPSLPTGCEVTALTAVLNYYGFNVNNTYLSKHFLNKGPVGTTSPSMAFVGEPSSKYAFGCFAPVIVECAENYLKSQGSSLRAYDTTGTSLDSLFAEVVKGHPVIIWATMYMSASYETTIWNADGSTISWPANEHCVVLYGYDKERNVVMIADPLKGNVEYPTELFTKRFDELLMQSVIIGY